MIQIFVDLFRKFDDSCCIMSPRWPRSASTTDDYDRYAIT